MILVYFKNLSIFIQLLWDLNTPRWLGLYHCYRCIFLLHFYYTFGHIFLLHFFSIFYWKLQKAIAKSYAGVLKKKKYVNFTLNICLCQKASPVCLITDGKKWYNWISPIRTKSTSVIIQFSCSVM